MKIFVNFRLTPSIVCGRRRSQASFARYRDFQPLALDYHPDEHMEATALAGAAVLALVLAEFVKIAWRPMLVAEC